MFGLLLAAFASRAVGTDQPIVENYVGRQVPTAMVARNLGRGSGWLHPRLDTGPFPNLFLIEPPIFAACAVGLDRLTSIGLEPSGRLTSALAIVLGAWGLHGLVRRREGASVAVWSLYVFILLPVTLRYGRAFQPDALMLGAILAGLRCWDQREAGGGRGRLVAGWVLLAIGLAVKVIAAYVLVPLLWGIFAERRPRRVALAVSTLLPALLWYGYAATKLEASGGSRASADNAAIWASALVAPTWLEPARLALIARLLVVRAFTPVAFALAIWGFTAVPVASCLAMEEESGRGGRRRTRLWATWWAAASVALVLLGGKLHHEYYFLALAPLIAVGVGRVLASLAVTPRVVAAAVLALACPVQSASTWRTPAEWSTLGEAKAAISGHVPRGSLVVAREAVLFVADRRGCRLESEPAAARRAAGEWGGTIDGRSPLDLVEFYRLNGASFVADVGDPARGMLRDPLHEAIRRRYTVIVDRPGLILAALRPDGPTEHQDVLRRRRRPRDPARLRPLEGRRAEDRRAHGL